MEISYLITAFVMIIVAVILYIVFFGSEEDFHNYVEDKLYEVPWRWEWKKELIVNLKCHCPKCDETLVYENDFILHKTYFLCTSCDTQRAVIGGGDSKYAFGIVKREIQRKVRTKEYKNLISR